MTDKKCFVLMPFTVKDADEGKYPDRNHWMEVYEGLIRPAAESADMLCSREDTDIGSRLIVESILRKIEDADLVVCDLSSHNPNVFLELGWALRSDKPYVLLKDDLTTFTFDLSQQYTSEYDHRLQPTMLSRNISELSKTMADTLKDQERRFSVVRRMALDTIAIQAANSGDKQMQVLLEVQQMLRRIPSWPQMARLTPDMFPWPELLTIAMDFLFKARQALEGKSSVPKDPATVLRQAVERMNLKRRPEIQLSLVSSDRKFIYHDWDDMVGRLAKFTGLNGADMYDQIFFYPAGAVAWVDRTTNTPRPLPQGYFRYSVALFSSVEGQDGRLVVETHYEAS